MDIERLINIAPALIARITATAARLLDGGGAVTPDDIAQETMLRLWTMRADLDTPSSAEAMAVTIGRRLAIDELRCRHLPVPVDTLSECADAEAGADRLLTRSDALLSTSRMLASLPPRQAMVLRMRHVDGMETDEIAAATGLDAGNIRVLLSRARCAARSFISSHPNLF